MDCRQCRNRLNAFLDGEVSEEEAADIEEHLSGCRACRTEYKALQRTAEAVRALPRQKAPDDLAENVRDNLGSSTGAARVLRIGLPVAASIAAALLVAVFLRGDAQGPAGPEPVRPRDSRVAPARSADRQTEKQSEQAVQAETAQAEPGSRTNPRVVVLRTSDVEGLHARIQSSYKAYVAEPTDSLKEKSPEPGAKVLLEIPRLQYPMTIENLKKLAQGPQFGGTPNEQSGSRKGTETGPEFRGTPLAPPQKPRAAGTPSHDSSQKNETRVKDDERRAAKYVLVRIVPAETDPDKEKP